MPGSRGKSRAGHCSSRSREEEETAGLGQGSLGNHVQCFEFCLSFLSFLVGLHCCDGFTGCWGDVDFRRISHFLRKVL